MTAVSGFFGCSYGNVRLWASRIETDNSRTQVVHELTEGDDYVVQDRGKKPLRTRVDLLFDWMDGDDMTPRQRFDALDALHSDGKPHMFTHPMRGSYMARIGEFHDVLDNSSVISATVEVIRVEPFVGVLPAGPSSIAVAGDGALGAAADAATSAMAEIGRPSSVAADAVTKSDAWGASGTVNARDVMVDTGALSSRIGSEAGELENDIGFWSAFKANINLVDALHEAAAASLADSATTFAMKLVEPVALRALVASIYPADEADLRYDQFLSLNDVDSPAWLDPVKIYKLPALVPESRQG